MSTVTKKFFGTAPNGAETSLYTIKNASGAYVTVSDYGVTVVNIVVPDRDGVLDDIVLGFDNPTRYEETISYYGATVGRVANRIKDGKYTLNGKDYQLTINNGTNNLHSAEGCLAFKMYTAEIVENGVAFTRLSPAGEGGFPGNLKVTVTVTFDENNYLLFDYKATGDEDTVVAMTQHSFFNLGGHKAGITTGEFLKLNASFRAVIDDSLAANGEIVSVAGTPFDFREFKCIGDEPDADDQQLKIAGGYDHCFILDKSAPNEFELCATLKDDRTGRYLECYTTKPAIQLYCGNFIEDGTIGKDGAEYCYRGAVCLETQYVPNAINYPHLGSPILRKGEEYHHVTGYQFGTY